MLICVTNRQLCHEDFLQRISKLAKAKPGAIMLREKDLDLPAYEQLAGQVKAICDRDGVMLIIHKHAAVAEKLKCTHLQLAMAELRIYKRGRQSLCIGASVHSVAEAEEAQALGANYLVAGHIYATDCKKGLSPRGAAWLRQVCQAVAIPVFAIGGISGEKAKEVVESGAKGFCIMSKSMTCDNPARMVQEFKKVE